VITTFAMLVPLLVPLVLGGLLIRFKPGTRLEWVMAAWLAVSFSLFYFLAGAWFLLSVYVRHAIAGLVLIALVVSFLRLPKGITFTNISTARDIFPLASYLLPALIFTIMSASALLGYRYTGPAASLVFPLNNGLFYIAQAGGTTIVNAHHPHGSQSYAVDILQLNPIGRNAAGFNQTSLEQYAIFGSPVYSPCDGIVAAAENGLDDLPPHSPGDTAHPAGNHVYVDCSMEKVQVLLAHMKKGSLVVEEGMPVRAGTLIGQVGNSGNTTEPHLHIHARQGGTLDRVTSGTGIAILFGGRFPVRNDLLLMLPGSPTN
jgi:hypothetical protein